MARNDGKAPVYVVMMPSSVTSQPRRGGTMLAFIAVLLVLWSIIGLLVLGDIYPTQVGWSLVGALMVPVAILIVLFAAVRGSGVAGSVMEIYEDMRDKRK